LQQIFCSKVKNSPGVGGSRGTPFDGRRKSPEIDLPPGKFKVTLKVASGAAQDREFEVAVDRPGACWSVQPPSRSPCTFIY
jgi:hypothetical protein